MSCLGGTYQNSQNGTLKRVNYAVYKLHLSKLDLKKQTILQRRKSMLCAVVFQVLSLGPAVVLPISHSLQSWAVTKHAPHTHRHNHSLWRVQCSCQDSHPHLDHRRLAISVQTESVLRYDPMSSSTSSDLHSPLLRGPAWTTRKYSSSCLHLKVSQLWLHIRILWATCQNHWCVSSL